MLPLIKSLTQIFYPLLFAVIVMVSSFGLGGIVLKWIGYRNRKDLESFIYSVTIGMGLIALLVFWSSKIENFFPKNSRGSRPC
jgi:O-antigen/teichoic acid export membrane protein